MDEGESDEFRHFARTIYRELVERNPADERALLGLSNVERNLVGRIARLRDLADVSPHNPRALESLGLAIGTTREPADLIEGAGFLERAYALQRGNKKWNVAADVMRMYDQAGATALADEFSDIVRADFELDMMMDYLLRPASLDRERTDEILQAICYNAALTVFGPDHCIEGIQAVVRRATTDASGPGMEMLLAETAVNAMTTVMMHEWRMAPETRGRFTSWVEPLLESDQATASVFVAYARLTTDRADRLLAMQNAARLDRDDGEIRFGLALAYVDLERWREAAEELRVARELLPPSRHEDIDRWLRVTGQSAVYPDGDE